MTTVGPWAASLLELTNRLVGIGADDDLQGSDWLTETIVAFAETPFLHDLDTYLLDLLLTWAGFDLSRSESLQAAAFVTAMVGGGGYVSVLGNADEVSAVWELATSGAFEHHWAAGAEFGRSDDGVEARQIAAATAGRLFLDAADAANFLERDEERPEAA